MGRCALRRGQRLPPRAEQDVVVLGQDHRAEPDGHLLLLFFRGFPPFPMSAPKDPGAPDAPPSFLP